MSIPSPIPGAVPIMKVDDARWDRLPYLKTWIIWFLVNGLIAAGFCMIYSMIIPTSLLAILADEGNSSWTRLLFRGFFYVIPFWISFITFRWALQKFLLPKI